MKIRAFILNNTRMILGVLLVIVGVFIATIKVLQIVGAFLVIGGSALIFKHIRVKKEHL